MYSLQQLVPSEIVDPTGEEDWIVLAPEETMPPASHPVPVQPLHVAIHVVRVELSLCGLELVPLHRVLSHGVVEVVLGEVAVGVVAVVEASLDRFGAEGGAWKLVHALTYGNMSADTHIEIAPLLRVQCKNLYNYYTVIEPVR